MFFSLLINSFQFVVIHLNGRFTREPQSNQRSLHYASLYVQQLAIPYGISMLHFNAFHLSSALLQVITGIFDCLSICFVWFFVQSHPLISRDFYSYYWQILDFMMTLFARILCFYVTIDINITSVVALATYSNCINAMYDTARHQLELSNEIAS